MIVVLYSACYADDGSTGLKQMQSEP